MSNNKARLFQLYRFLYENSDEQHTVTTADILSNSVTKDERCEGTGERNIWRT